MKIIKEREREKEKFAFFFEADPKISKFTKQQEEKNYKKSPTHIHALFFCFIGVNINFKFFFLFGCFTRNDDDRLVIVCPYTKTTRTKNALNVCMLTTHICAFFFLIKRNLKFKLTQKIIACFVGWKSSLWKTSL